MNLRILFKEAVPPALARIIQNYRHGLVSGPIWEGVYSHYRDVPGHGEGYHGAELAARTYKLTEELLAAWHDGEGSPLPPFPGGAHAPLALVASVLGGRQGRVRVLDFGGGMGIGFVHLLASVQAGTELRYDVVETSVMCEGGRRLFANDRRIGFHTELPERPPAGELDIVYISSALQYVEDYAGLLGELCAYGARHILLTNLSAGEVPTYAAAQRNLRGMRLPHWFLNISEVVELMEAGRYTLAFASLGDREYDQRNLPPACRVRHSCNLLFTQVDSAA